MRQRQWLLLFSGFLVLSLQGCGSTSSGSERGTIAVPTSASAPTAPTTPPKASAGGDPVSGADDSVAATASVGGSISVTVGAVQTINVVFTSNDGNPMSGFAVSGSLATLPTGWSGPGSFTCGAVAPGSGCVLTLTYAPLALDSGTFTLNCVFVDNAMTPRTPGPCLTLSYVSTAANNVVAAPSLAGEVDAVIGGGAQALNLNFTTDDGNPATALTLTTDLHSLPAGWSSSAANFSCALVRTGNGCQLPLSFSPGAATRATLALNYSYLDNTGAARSGSVNIPYASVAVGTVVAGAAPMGQINAVETTGTTSVSVTFTSNDGNTATNLVLVTDLGGLPAGWSSTSTAFGCASVSTGNGCQLALKYAPAALSSGTLTLRYDYADESGAVNTGLVNLAYAATTNDNILATPSTSGQVNAMLGASQPLAVVFTTDDGRAATGLQITDSLTALPPGWSSSVGTFGCVAVASGSGCQLALTYAPTVTASGTLVLGFTYLNNAGESKTGTLSIPYRATANDNVTAMPNPLVVAAAIGANDPVTVVFNTDDANVATALTADLSALPAGWSSTSSSFSCGSVSTGSGCVLALSYAPTAAASGTLSFTFGYTNNAAIAKTATVSIPYSTVP
jgi:hypothetical protein